MKRILWICIAFMLIFPSISFAEDSQNHVTINTYQADLTGDGKVDEIVLKGTPFSNGGDYYHQIWAEIKTQDQEWVIHYGDGYEPKLQLIDSNHDQVQDILFQSTTRKNKRPYNQKLHTISNHQLEEIKLPALRYVSGKFVDDFNIHISFSPYEKPKQINVEAQADLYIKAGLYHESGKLNRQKSLSLQDATYYEPVKLSEHKGYGMKSYKQVYGISPADQIGTIETLWYYEDGKWVAVQSDWKNDKIKQDL